MARNLRTKIRSGKGHQRRSSRGHGSQAAPELTVEEATAVAEQLSLRLERVAKWLREGKLREPQRDYYINLIRKAYRPLYATKQGKLRTLFECHNGLWRTPQCTTDGQPVSDSLANSFQEAFEGNATKAATHVIDAMELTFVDMRGQLDNSTMARVVKAWPDTDKGAKTGSGVSKYEALKRALQRTEITWTAATLKRKYVDHKRLPRTR